MRELRPYHSGSRIHLMRKGRTQWISLCGVVRQPRVRWDSLIEGLPCMRCERINETGKHE